MVYEIVSLQEDLKIDGYILILITKEYFTWDEKFAIYLTNNEEPE